MANPTGHRRRRHPRRDPLRCCHRRHGRSSDGRVPRLSRAIAGSGWARSFGRVDAVGVEGSGAYGAGLARHLASERSASSRCRDRTVGCDAVVESPTPSTPKLPPGRCWPEGHRGPQTRRRADRGHPSAASGQDRSGEGEDGGHQHTASDGRHRSRATAGSAARSGLPNKIIDACALRPDTDQLQDPMQATKAALRSVAVRAKASTRGQVLDRQLAQLVAAVAPPPCHLRPGGRHDECSARGDRGQP